VIWETGDMQQIAFACITIILAASIIYIITRLRKLDENVQHLYKAQQLAVSREEFEEYQQRRQNPTLLMCPLEGEDGGPVVVLSPGPSIDDEPRIVELEEIVSPVSPVPVPADVDDVEYVEVDTRIDEN
jgi:hypothetical protein